MADPVSSGATVDSAAHRDDAGVEFSRIVAFSDGVFAIAITLLVLSLQVPDTATDLGHSLARHSDDLFAYGLSFAVIGKFWISHHRFYGALARFDSRLMGLNLFYLAWVALVPFSSDLLGNFSESTEAVVVYAANMAAASLTFTIQIVYAYRRDLMRPEARPQQRRYAGPANFVFAAVFVLSMPVALVSTYAAQAIWLAIFFVGRRAADRLAGHSSRR